MSSGLLFDPRFLHHDTGSESLVKLSNGQHFQAIADAHPSASSIIARTWEFLQGTGLASEMVPLIARSATEEELLSFHTPDYLKGLVAACSGGPRQGDWGMIDEDTQVSEGSYEAALLAAGGAMNTVQAVMEGRVRNAFALLRPPGHHATRNQALGFCLFNNTVLAAHYARRTYGLRRIAILDWDAHHGNGTQQAFYEDDEVLFLSMHQQHWYPGDEGTLAEVGAGRGEGYTINIPLPPGTGNPGFYRIFDEIVYPVLEAYRPELVLVSAGQDASWMDPLARLTMTMRGYHQLTRRLVKWTEALCEGRLVCFQEGGYSGTYVPYCTTEIVSALLGVPSHLLDPNEGAPELLACERFSGKDTDEAIERAKTQYRRWWPIRS